MHSTGHKAMLRSVRLSVPFCDSIPFDGDMRASLFQTHSIGSSTLGYARIQRRGGGISFHRTTTCYHMSRGKKKTTNEMRTFSYDDDYK